MSKQLGSYYGVPITNHDLKRHTDPRERRGYRIFEVVSGSLMVIFAVMSIARVPSDLGPGVWWVASLLAAGYFFTFFPIAFPRKRANSGQGELEGQFNQTRLDSFWYERSVADNTDEDIIIEDQEPGVPPKDDQDRPLP